MPVEYDDIDSDDDDNEDDFVTVRKHVMNVPKWMPVEYDDNER